MVANGIDYGEQIEALRENQERLESEVLRELGNVSARLGHLTGAYQTIADDVSEIRQRLPPKLPPMRDPELSQQGLEDIATKAMHAALEGERRADSTPEQMVQRLIAEETSKRERAARLAALELADADRLEAKKRAAEGRRKVINGIIGGLGLAGALRLIEWIATLHH